MCAFTKPGHKIFDIFQMEEKKNKRELEIVVRKYLLGYVPIVTKMARERRKKGKRERERTEEKKEGRG